MASYPGTSPAFTSTLDDLFDTIQKLSTLVGQAFHYLSPTTRALLTSTTLALLLKLYLQKGRRKIHYISRLEDVAGPALGNEAMAADKRVTATYDIVIIGGGTAGCALASRLSEVPSLRVLLLESGGSGKAIVQSRTPASHSNLLPMKKYVHHFWTEMQAAAHGHRKFWPRAKILGGCSSINAQMAQYGAPGDFDEWASIIGDESWSWKHLSRYFRKFESYKPDPRFPRVDHTARGDAGPVQVGYFNTVVSSCKIFVESCMSAGISFTPDFNGPYGTLGVGRVMTYISSKFQRVSSETAYLTPDVLARPNLKVAVHATVTRVLFETCAAGGKPQAVGAELAASETGPRFQVNARKQVIVCAGAVQSPQILMHSGIGPAAHLKSHDIPVVLDLPGVGKNLVDHPVINMYFKLKRDISTVEFLRPKGFADTLKLGRALVQYYVLGLGGALAMNFADAAAFVRSDDPSLFPLEDFPEKLVDSTSAKDSPDLEYFSTPVAYKPRDVKRTFFDVPTFGLHVYLLRPTSRGAVLLKSNNPFTHPSIDPSYISTHEDRAKLVRGIRLAVRIAHSEPLGSHLGPSSDPTNPDDLDNSLDLKSDAELEDIVRQRVETIYHPTSSCRMAPRDQGGVVDSALRVYGVEGLRICDASVFPSIVSGHTAGACYAVAEKLADQMKGEFTAGEL